ncbi:fumarylacetoacetate hydrolase family protein [Novosphingobium colocasiae]
MVGLVNDVSLRNLIPAELAKGFGFYQSKPGQRAVTLAGDARRAGRTVARRQAARHAGGGPQRRPFGRADAGTDMTFDFGTLIAHLAKTRSLGAGTIVGSGTVSNRDADGGPGRPVAQGGLGYSCIAELRMVETIRDGAPSTPFLQPGDRVRITMDGPDGASLFGAIEQVVGT